MSRKDGIYLLATTMLAGIVFNAYAGIWSSGQRLDLYSLLTGGGPWSAVGWGSQEWLLLMVFGGVVYFGLTAEQGATEAEAGGSEALPSGEPASYRPLGPGELIGSYQVEALIHAGSFISRYRVRHTRLETHHCLLTITRDVPMIRDRQHQAGRLQASLRHPNLVRATDMVVVGDDLPSVVLDWYDGALLSRHIALTGPMAVDDVDGLAVGLCRALDHMHQHGLVHRNVKPGGIALIRSGKTLVPKLTDLALTKVRSSEHKMTQAFTKMLIGTPAYMPPEQIHLPDEVTEAADVWSLCVVLYEALAGHPPFQGDDARAVLGAVRKGEFEPIEAVVPGLPQRVIDALGRGLEYDVEDRIGSMRELLEIWCGDEEHLGTLHSIPAPSGDVTLVFTDVEGSTAFWDEDPGLMSKVLTAHDSIMRSQLTHHGGYEVKTEGDAFMVAFPRPELGIQWCLDVQTAIDEQPWPKEMRDLGWRLRVRMGVHCGSPQCRPHPTTGAMDYFGPMVNCAARISNAGHGGQVVASASVVERCGEALSELSFTQLGAYTLKGITEPQDLWQVGDPDARFPALRAEPFSG